MSADGGQARTEATGADLIARRLAKAGCRFAFGIPGGEVLALMDALNRAGIDFVLAKHENNAGFMAEGAWHRDGAPGVLLATLGPGVANAVNVVANAWQDRVPLIFLTGCVDDAEALSYTHQVFDHRALLAPITKASLRAVSGAVDTVIDKALTIALDGQPGPVHVDVPIGVAEGQEVPSGRAGRVRPLPTAPTPGPELDAARDRLAHAQRPLVIAGLDALTPGAAEAVGGLVAHHGIPLVTTYKAKGLVPEDHPLVLGGAGLSPKADALLLPLVRASDCLVLAGYDPIEMRIGWRDPWPADAPVIEFSAVPNTHYMHFARSQFVGDIGAGLDVLAAGLAPTARWPGGEIAAARAALAEAFGPGEADWSPAAMIHAARRVAPRDTLATVDSGAHRILLSQAWQVYEPRGLMQSTALCTMGCAVPLAAGAKLASPERPVIAFIGDAGLEMGLGELATLRDRRLPVVVVVFVDRSLALIELKQRRQGLQSVGVDFEHTDFAAVARALGGHGVSVVDTAAFEAALVEALAADRFTVIACEFARRAYDGAF
ncbi:MAG: thiamine pyrophosphate-binding protein [Azospirillaceae bacterium]